MAMNSNGIIMDIEKMITNCNEVIKSLARHPNPNDPGDTDFYIGISNDRETIHFVHVFTAPFGEMHDACMSLATTDIRNLANAIDAKLNFLNKMLVDIDEGPCNGNVRSTDIIDACSQIVNLTDEMINDIVELVDFVNKDDEESSGPSSKKIVGRLFIADAKRFVSEECKEPGKLPWLRIQQNPLLCKAFLILKRNIGGYHNGAAFSFA